jgi:trimeric autotransporter adhesin
MKKITTLVVITSVTGLFLSFSVNAQTLYVPGGTGGISSTSATPPLPNTNIGFGTSTPSNYLAGTNGLTLFGTYPGLAFATSTKTWLLYRQSDNSFRLWENSGVNVGDDRITVLPGGNVGIGTTAPASNSRLDIRGGALQVVNYSTNGYGIIARNADPGNNDSYFYHRITTNYHILGTNKNGTGTLRKLGFASGGSDLETDIKMTIDNTGNIGINNTSPSAKLQVTNGSVLFDGTTGTTPVSGGGTRMMWIPAKAAFRAGKVDGTQWDDANIGDGSFATGWNTIANGPYSFACGALSTSSGSYSFSEGVSSTASGAYSSAFGFGAQATGYASIAFGGSIAQSFSSFVLGQYNYNPGTYNSTSWVATDPLFVIGNGTNNIARSNALTVLKNGNTGIGTANPEAKLHIQNALGGSLGKISFDVLQWSNANIGWNSFYQGFNISRSASTSNWTSASDGARNGSSVILTNLAGDIHLATIASTGAAPVTLTDAQVFAAVKMKIQNDGKVLIGDPTTVTMPDGYKLFVQTGILTEKLKIAIKGTPKWSDYVFAKNYKLKSFEELESYIQTNKHLPNIPSAEEMVKNGLDVATMDAKLLEKIEELTLYVLDLGKQNVEMKKEIERLKKIQK